MRSDHLDRRQVVHGPHVVAVALLIAVTACDAPGVLPVEPSATPLLAARAEPVDHPWAGRCETVFTPTGPLTIEITGICQLAGLGRVALVAEQELVPGPTGIALSNTATYTAANGDVLRTTNVGIGTPASDFPGVLLTGTETAVGGTGRFAEATGTATILGSAVLAGPAANTGEFTVSGTLRYAASDRAR
jgi:hypothetical protein